MRAHTGLVRPLREKPCPSDPGGDEWAFVAPRLGPPPEGAPRRRHDLREVFDALRRIARAGAPRRTPPRDLPPWRAARQRATRWPAAGVLEATAHDLRVPSRDLAGRRRRPSAAILGSRTLRSAPEGGARAGRGGAERRRGSRPHPAADTLGHPLAARVAPAGGRDRAQVARLAAAVQAATGEGVETAHADQGHAGAGPAGDAAAHGIRPEVVGHAGAGRGLVLPPRRRAVGRPLARAARFRRLARDHERLPSTPAGLRFLAFVRLMAQEAAPLLASGP